MPLVFRAPHNGAPDTTTVEDLKELKRWIGCDFVEMKTLGIPFRDDSIGYFSGWIQLIFDEDGLRKRLPVNRNAPGLVGNVAVIAGYTACTEENDWDQLIDLTDVFVTPDGSTKFMSIMNRRIEADRSMHSSMFGAGQGGVLTGKDISAWKERNAEAVRARQELEVELQSFPVKRDVFERLYVEHFGNRK